MNEHTFDTELSDLLERDPVGASSDELADGLRRIQALRTAVEAAEARWLAAFDRTKAWRADGAVSSAAWLGSNSRVSAREAKERVEAARTLDDLPAAGRALEQARISRGHVAALATATELAGSQAVASGERELVEAATELGVDEFRRHVRDWARRQRDDEGMALAEQQRRRQEVRTFTSEDGMVGVRAELDPEGGAVFTTELRRIADDLWRANHPNLETDPGSALEAGHLRAEAMVEMARRAGAADPESAVMPKPSVVVFVDESTLVEGLHEAGRSETVDGEPLAPAAVRRLACDAGIIPMTLSSAGQPLDVGRLRRLPTPAQRLALIVRDGGCRFPGCSRPHWMCQAHHIIAWEHWGPTDLDNLVLVCTKHHRLVHEGGWTIERVGGGFEFVRPGVARRHPVGRSRAGPAPIAPRPVRRRDEQRQLNLSGAGPP